MKITCKFSEPGESSNMVGHRFLLYYCLSRHLPSPSIRHQDGAAVTYLYHKGPIPYQTYHEEVGSTGMTSTNTYSIHLLTQNVHVQFGLLIYSAVII